MKLKPVFKKMVLGGDPNDPGPPTATTPVDAGLTGTGNQFAWAADTTQPGLSTGFNAPHNSIDWNGILNGVSKVGTTIAPYASNIANAFRRPPMPNQPGLVNPVVLSKINLSNAKNSILRQTHSADAQANKYLDPQSAAAVRVANLSKGIEGTSQVAEQEGFLNSRQQAEQAGMNLNVNAMNVGAMNHYRDALTERNIASQREQSANLANATDKYIGINNEKAKADLDMKKIGVLSQMWKDSGVYDRMLSKMKKQGIDDPTGILAQREGYAYGGRVFAEGGDIGPGEITAKGVSVSKSSGYDDATTVDNLNAILAGTSRNTNLPGNENLAMQAYLWKQQNPTYSPEQTIQSFYDRPVDNDPNAAIRQRLGKIGYGPVGMYNTTPNVSIRKQAFGGFNPATKSFGMPRGKATEVGMLSPFGASRSSGLGRVTNGRANVKGSMAKGSKMFQDGGGIGNNTPDGVFEEDQRNVLMMGGAVYKTHASTKRMKARKVF